MKLRTSLLLLTAASLLQAAPPLNETAPDGTVTILPPPMAPEFKNPVSLQYEKGFRDRYNLLLKRHTGMGDNWQKVDNRRFFESEKWSYPNAMMHVLAGNVEPGMNILQAGDQPQNPNDHSYTKGIDLWAAFTLKGQTRKYFQFGHLMDPGYKQTFEEAIDIWTESHPRHTPHPYWKKYHHKEQGWGPNRFGNRRLDGRRTDNLYAMSTIAVYLFAEATGNEETRLRARDELYGYIWALYNIGHGEWDSTTYHPHVVAPYLTLYDFAKDPEVKMAAKTALDHFFTAAALKNHRNTFAGASKREYQQVSFQNEDPFAAFFWLYFPVPGIENPDKEHDQLHAMASNYRPAPAILNLAARNLELPVEIQANKPNYENWKAGASEKPRSFETLYLANTYTAGTVIEPGGNGDMLPFRITFDRGATGTNCLTVNSSGKMNQKSGRDHIAQYRNLILWLGQKSDSDYTFTWAEDGDWTVKGDHWFYDGGDTWFAVTPINLGQPQSGSPGGKLGKKHPQARITTAPQGDAPYSGFAMEIQEKGGTYRTFNQFVQAYTSRSGLDLSALADGKALFKGSEGMIVGLKHQGGLPEVWRNGEQRDLNNPAEWAVWRTVDREQPVVDLPWKGSGTLTVRAGSQLLQTRFQLKDRNPAETERSHLEGFKRLQADVDFRLQ